jgi:uncharacterized protein
MSENTTTRNELVKQFVIAGHGSLARVKELLEQDPSLLNEAYAWNEKDHETAIQGAAQVGSVPVAEYLLSKGAPLEICTAAMLGRQKDVEEILERDPNAINATGAHGIPLLAHAALSGNVELVSLLVRRGATSGMSMALSNAVSRRKFDVAQYLLENGKPDLNWKNYEGKNVLGIAVERKDPAMEELIRKHMQVAA